MEGDNIFTPAANIRQFTDIHSAKFQKAAQQINDMISNAALNGCYNIRVEYEDPLIVNEHESIKKSLLDKGYEVDDIMDGDYKRGFKIDWSKA